MTGVQEAAAADLPPSQSPLCTRRALAPITALRSPLSRLLLTAAGPPPAPPPAAGGAMASARAVSSTRIGRHGSTALPACVPEHEHEHEHGDNEAASALVAASEVASESIRMRSLAESVADMSSTTDEAGAPSGGDAPVAAAARTLGTADSGGRRNRRRGGGSATAELAWTMNPLREVYVPPLARQAAARTAPRGLLAASAAPASEPHGSQRSSGAAYPAVADVSPPL